MRLVLASLLLLTAACRFDTRDEDFAIPDERPAAPVAQRPVQPPTTSPGYGGTFDTQTKLRVSTERYVEVRAGALATCARTSDGKIDCWGKTPNDPQHLGAEIALRDGTVCVLGAQGDVKCWGDTRGYVVPEAGPLHALGLGYRFACALDATDHPQCWGPAAIAAPDDVELKTLAVGWGHACGLKKSDGTIVCWGSSSTNGAVAPGGAFEKLAAGGLMSCAIDARRQVKCWGDSKGPVTNAALLDVAVGNGVACGVTDDNAIVCWGNDLLAIKDAPYNRYVQVSVGTDHACALRTDGRVVCWGGNDDGQSYPP